MKPTERAQYLNVYYLCKLDTMGKITVEASSVTEQGDLGVGFYSKLEIAQYQQTILALKGIKAEIFHLEYPL